jgi:tRNA-2-methylthio-N6-dimethylallyladenosine synthase
MKRDYTREEYLRRIDFIQSSPSEIALSTDVIVGFPGESQEDFEETLSLLEQVRYDQIFSFKYSARPGTEAFGFGDPIPERRSSSGGAAGVSAQIQINNTALVEESSFCQEAKRDSD